MSLLWAMCRRGGRGGHVRKTTACCMSGRCINWAIVCADVRCLLLVKFDTFKEYIAQCSTVENGYVVECVVDNLLLF